MNLILIIAGTAVAAGVVGFLIGAAFADDRKRDRRKIVIGRD